jgi:hypothetical protein
MKMSKLRILFVRENKDVVRKKVNVNNNQFTINKKLYMVDNPDYNYSKLSFFEKNFGKKMILIYIENNPLPFMFSKSNVINQLQADVVNDLFFSKVIKEAMGSSQDINIILFLYFYQLLFKIPFNRLTRFVLNRFFNTRVLYEFLHATNISQKFLIQDISLPKESTLKFLELIDKEVNIYPLWLCPLKPTKDEKLSPTFNKTDLVINVGIWGEVDKDFNNFVTFNKTLENQVRGFNGREVLYAQEYYSEEDFWKIYDKEWYINLRNKYYSKDIFPDIYEKTKVKEKYKESFLSGLIKVIRSELK